jgi:hypothetical protein
MEISFRPDKLPLVRGRKGSDIRNLRGTVVLREHNTEDPTDDYFWETKGCLICRREETGELQLFLPRSQFGKTASFQTNHCSPSIEKTIIEAITASPYAEYIGKPGPEGLQSGWMPEALKETLRGKAA